MMSVLKSKLALLIHTKVGATILAATLVAGGGSAVAAVATHGGMSNISSTIASVTGGSHDTTSGTHTDNPADHESMEGALTAYTAPSGSTAGSITVQPDTGSAATFVVNASTRVNGYHAESQNGGGQNSAAQQSAGSQNGYEPSEGTPGTGYHSEGTPSAGHQSDDGAVGSLSDLQTAVTLKYRVQVQANKSGDTWVASKVTVEGPGTDKSGQSGNDDGGQHGGSQNEQVVAGKVKSVGGTSFIVTTVKGDVTVDVDGSTSFEGVGQPSSVNDLKTGMYVAAQGTAQSDGSVLASTVYVGWSGDPSGGYSHEPTPSVSTESGH
jgi:Domain of unknown function (DUF5666)